MAAATCSVVAVTVFGFDGSAGISCGESDSNNVHSAASWCILVVTRGADILLASQMLLTESLQFDMHAYIH